MAKYDWQVFPSPLNQPSNQSPRSSGKIPQPSAWIPKREPQSSQSHTVLSPQSRSQLDVKMSPESRELLLHNNRNTILAQVGYFHTNELINCCSLTLKWQADQIVREAGCFQAQKDISQLYTPLRPKQGVRSPRTAPKSAATSSITQREWPDPVLSLKHIVGFSSDCANSLLWTPDGSACIYASSSTIVLRSFENAESTSNAMIGIQSTNSVSNQADDGSSADSSAKSSTEYFLRGHCNPISAFALTGEPTAFLASAEQATQQQAAMIRLWDLVSHECLTVIKAQARGVHTMCFSTNRKQTRMICAVGYDETHRTQIIVWDCSGITMNEGVTSAAAVVAKQTCDFPITRITFSPYEPDQLVSCGRENIRYWRIRNKSMPGWPVILKEYSRGTIFTDMGFDQLYQAFPSNLPRMRPLYAATSQGTLVVVDYDSREVLCVYKLHDGAINCLAMNEGFCVTGSDDRYLRVWPLDFTDFFLEAQHEGAVSAVNVSPDGMKVLVGSCNGAIGILNIAEQRYDSLLRSHTQEVVAMATCSMPSNTDTGFTSLKQEVVTASLDGTLRIWDLANAQQCYELDLQNDQVTCIALHPGNEGVIALGFKSGCTRIFDVLQASTQPLHEFQQHQSALCHLAYDMDGEFLYTSAEGQQLCLYDARLDRRYAPVKMLMADFHRNPGRFVLSLDNFNLVLISGDQQSVLVLNARSLFVVSTITLAQHQYGQKHQDRAAQVQISPTSAELLVLTKADRMLIYSMQTHELLQSLVLIGQGGIASFALSPNMKYMATGGCDGSLRVWKCDGRPMITRRHQSFLGQTGVIRDLSFSIDGQSVVGTGTTGTMFIWNFHGDCSQPSVKMPSPVRLLSSAELNSDRLVSELLKTQDNKENHHRQPQQVCEQEDDSEEMSPSFFVPVPNSKPKSFSLSLASDTFVLAKNANHELNSVSTHSKYLNYSIQEVSLVMSTTHQAQLQPKCVVNGIDPTLVAWSYPTGLLLFAFGPFLVVEEIETGVQSIYNNHGEDCDSVDLSPPQIVLLRLSASKLRVATVASSFKTVCIRELMEQALQKMKGHESDTNCQTISLPEGVSAVDALELFGKGTKKEDLLCLACKHLDVGESTTTIWVFDVDSGTVLWGDRRQNPSPYRPQIQQLLALPGHGVVSFSSASNRLELHSIQSLDVNSCEILDTTVLVESFPSAVHCVHVHTDPTNGKTYLIGVDGDAYCVFYDLHRRSVIATTQLLCIKSHRPEIQFQQVSWVTSEDAQLIVTGGHEDNMIFVHSLPAKASRRQISVDWRQVARAGLPLLRKITFDETLRGICTDSRNPLALVTSDYSVTAVQLTNACTKRILKQRTPARKNANESLPQDHTERLQCASWALESACVLSLAVKDNAIRCWIPEVAREVAHFQVKSLMCTCFTVSPSCFAGSGYSPRSLVFAGYADDTLRVFNLCSLQLIAQCQLPHRRHQPDHFALKRLKDRRTDNKQSQNAEAPRSGLERIHCIAACALIVITADQRVVMVDVAGILSSSQPKSSGRQSSKLKPNVPRAKEIVCRELALHDANRKRLLSIGAIDIKLPIEALACETSTIHPFIVSTTEQSDLNPWVKTTVKVFAHPEMAIAADERLPVTDEWQISSHDFRIPPVAFASSACDQQKIVYGSADASEPAGFYFEVRDYARRCVLQRLVVDHSCSHIAYPISIRRFPVNSSGDELALLTGAKGSMALLDLQKQVIIPITGTSHLGFHPLDISSDRRLLLASHMNTLNSGRGGGSTLCMAAIAITDLSDAIDSAT